MCAMGYCKIGAARACEQSRPLESEQSEHQVTDSRMDKRKGWRRASSASSRETREYPLRDRTITVTQCGRNCIGRRKINLTQVIAGQKGNRRENLAGQYSALRLGVL